MGFATGCAVVVDFESYYIEASWIEDGSECHEADHTLFAELLCREKFKEPPIFVKQVRSLIDRLFALNRPKRFPTPQRNEQVANDELIRIVNDFSCVPYRF